MEMGYLEDTGVQAELQFVRGPDFVRIVEMFLAEEV